MLRFDFPRLFWLAIILKEEKELCDMVYPSTEKLKDRIADQERIREFLTNVLDDCKSLGLVYTQKHTQRMLGMSRDENITFKEFASLYGELIHRISDEVEEYTFFRLPKEKSQYYSNPIDMFGKEIVEKFPSARLEVEEAGKCYAAGRYTASVFHLMRVLELGIRALRRSLGLPASSNRNWESVLKKCDQELKKPHQERSVQWNTDETFFAEATANLRAVKDAWRNTTMHIEHIYDDEKAGDLFNAVRAFMRHLSVKLSE